jgi:hypothetical protein
MIGVGVWFGSCLFIGGQLRLIAGPECAASRGIDIHVELPRVDYENPSSNPWDFRGWGSRPGPCAPGWRLLAGGSAFASTNYSQYFTKKGRGVSKVPLPSCLLFTRVKL